MRGVDASVSGIKKIAVNSDLSSERETAERRRRYLVWKYSWGGMTFVFRQEVNNVFLPLLRVYRASAQNKK